MYVSSIMVNWLEEVHANAGTNDTDMKVLQANGEADERHHVDELGRKRRIFGRSEQRSLSFLQLPEPVSLQLFDPASVPAMEWIATRFTRVSWK